MQISRIEALVGAISELAQRWRFWLPLPLHSQMPVEQQDGTMGSQVVPQIPPVMFVGAPPLQIHKTLSAVEAWETVFYL